MTAHSHCHFCGAAYPTDTNTWPRTCVACNQTAYRNPLPVAVSLVPVIDETTLKQSLLAVTRTIAPAGLALPGGFIDFGENWRDAAVREVSEETGLASAIPDTHDAFSVRSAPDGTVLVFVVTEAIFTTDMASLRGSDETSGVALITEDNLGEIVFSLHREVAESWLRQANRTQA